MSENPDNGHYDPAMDDYEQEDECPNCGGEGVVYSCFEEWACADPESGCDLCERLCDWCKPKKKTSVAAWSEAATKAKAAAEQVMEDAKIDLADLQKPMTNFR